MESVTEAESSGNSSQVSWKYTQTLMTLLFIGIFYIINYN